MAPVRRSAAGGVLPESPGHGPRPVDLPHPLRSFGGGGSRLAHHVLLRERARRYGVHLQPVHLHRARRCHRPRWRVWCAAASPLPSGSCFCARPRAPSRIPVGRRLGLRGTMPMPPMPPMPSPMWRETVRPLRRARSPRGRLPSLRQRPCLRRSLLATSAAVRVLFVIYAFAGSFLGLFDTATVSLSEDLNSPDFAGAVLMASGAVSMTAGFLFGMVRLRRRCPSSSWWPPGAVGLSFGTCSSSIRRPR